MRIAILDCSRSSDLTLERFGSVGDMVTGWLAPHLSGAVFTVIPVAMGAPLPEVGSFDGFILPGSGCDVHDATPWMTPLMALLTDIRRVQKPLLGICFGHQLMAQTFGGHSAQADHGMAGGVRCWAVNGETIDAYALHSDQVMTLPSGARIVGGAEYCPAGVIVYDDFPAFSTQFHPEYDAPFVAAMISSLEGGEMGGAAAAAARRSLATPVRDDLLVGQAAALFRGDPPF